MSSFKHHRNSNYRYNIYNSHSEVIEGTSFYVPLRNTLFFLAVILSLLVTGLISFDIYKKKKNEVSKMLVINQVQQNLVKDEITHIQLANVISNSIIQKINTDNSIKNINNYQLKRIIKNVMEKVNNSHKQIIYTHK